MTSADPHSPSYMTSFGQSVIYYGFGLVVQTLVFGMYSVLIFLSTRMLLRRGFKTRINLIMFTITSFMYLLSAGYWMFSCVYVADRMRIYMELTITGVDRGFDTIEHWFVMFNAIITINYVLSDGIVVWRAWVICLRSHRKYMCIPFFFLSLTAVAVLLTIVTRIVDMNNVSIPHLADLLNTTQMTALGTSLISNLSSMGVVGATLWRHWKTIRVAFPNKSQGTKTNHTLALVVESGLLYSLSAIITLLFSVIPGKLPTGNTLGDLYTPINIQFAGAYPAVVLLLVSANASSLNDSTLSSGSPPIKSMGSKSMSSTPVISISPPHKDSTVESFRQKGNSSNRWSDNTFV
ncbi:hypothetical protein B0H19DRAFT_1094854 [Mycena capillaripes]|nr:hypothetical protein B0H19DRAFT_1094854 [Mycena capillaripes]